MMLAPGFWNNPPASPGAIARLLTPLGRVYASATARRVAKESECRLDIPVICVGNINVGGTGKTPAVTALVQHLQQRGVNPGVISRGYGGSIKGPVEVNTKLHGSADAGDEPLLLASFCRVWVSSDRAAAARAAAVEGIDAVIMDDGHQSPSPCRDLSIVVVDAKRGFGNGRCLPAGPLREPVSKGLSRADLLLSIGSDDAQAKFFENWGDAVRVPRIEARIHPIETGMNWNGARLLAFAGIGDPEKFFNSLRELGATLVKSEALEDHQPLTLALMARIEREAAALGAQMATTEKDAVRLPAAFKRKVLTLPVRLKIKDWKPLDLALRNIGL